MMIDRSWTNAERSARTRLWASVHWQAWGVGIGGHWYNDARGARLVLGPAEIGVEWGWLF